MFIFYLFCFHWTLEGLFLLMGYIPIGDAANWEHHQRLFNEILIFLPALNQRNQQNCFQKTLVMQYARKTKAILLSQHTLAIMHVSYSISLLWMRHVFIQFTYDFLYGEVKKIKIPSIRWWRFELATSAINGLHNCKQNKHDKFCPYPIVHLDWRLIYNCTLTFYFAHVDNSSQIIWMLASG